MALNRALSNLSFGDNVYVRLFHAEWFSIVPELWILNNQRNNFWRMYLQIGEGAFLTSAQEVIPLEEGRVYFVPSGVQFNARSHKNAHQFYVHFDVLGLHEIVMRELFDRIISLPREETLRSALHNLGEKIRDTPHLDLSQHLQLKGVIYEALARYIQTVPPERMERCREIAASLEPVLPALHYIEENLAEPISNRQLAQLCFMSDSYFIRRFRECVGQSPIQYIREQRIKMAAQQLLFTGQSIEQIATATGFGSRFYLTRVFTRYTGVAPAAYRKNSSA